MLAITGAKIITMADRIIEKGTILINDEGKIRQIEKNIDLPARSEVIAARGKIVIPGLVDAHTHLGIDEEGLGWEGDDYNEATDPITPHLRAIDGINPQDSGLTDARRHGITTVMSCPGSSNVLGGETVVIKTQGDVVDEMVVKNPAGIKGAVGENPKQFYGQQKGKMPATRMGIIGLLRKTLMEAQDYAAKKEKAEAKDQLWDRDIKLESAAQLFTESLPLKVHAHRGDDVMSVVRVAEEFDINVTIEHCTGGRYLADKLAAAEIPVSVGPNMSARPKVELKDKSLETASVLAKAGVKIALITDHPVTPIQNLRLNAALVANAGLSKLEALQAVTINPAEILGVDDRIGSLEPGKDADLAIFSGDPLQLDSQVEQVLIEGKRVL